MERNVQNSVAKFCFRSALSEAEDGQRHPLFKNSDLSMVLCEFTSRAGAMGTRPSSGVDSSPQVIVSAKASRTILWIS